MKKNLGMSLIEALLSLSILSIIALSAIQWAAEKQEKEFMLSFSKDLNGLLAAVDKRLVIDGLNENNLEEQLNSEDFGQSINLAFVSKDHNCGNKNDGWKPINGENFLLLPCDMWNKKVPFGFNIKSNVVYEKSTVYEVSFILSISKKNLERNKSLLIQIHNILSKNVNANMVGTQSYSLIDEEGNRYNKIECLKASDKCFIKAEFKVTPMFILKNDI
jgi:hypothetical protein